MTQLVDVVTVLRYLDIFSISLSRPDFVSAVRMPVDKKKTGIQVHKYSACFKSRLLLRAVICFALPGPRGP